MQRRSFLKNTGKIGAGAVILNGIPAVGRAQANTFSQADINRRIHVIVNLFGANDTLNTVVPSAQYNIYAGVRPKIAIPEASLLTLDTANNTNPTKLHPILSPLRDLYTDGLLHVVHGVGYNDNNRSHFKSDELWNTAGDSTPANFDFESGFYGQLFEHRYPGLLGSSTPAIPDPPCIELGSSSGSTMFQTALGNNASVLLTNNNIGGFYTTLTEVGGLAPAHNLATDHGNDTKFIADIQTLSNIYGNRIQTVFNAGSNSSTVYPSNNYLADQLKTVARLIKGGSRSTVYMVHQYGFDTHDVQTDATNPLTGNHTNLLKQLAEALKAFQTDITALGFADRIITTTHSEFGRTIDENGNMGTDHGGVSTMFVMGKAVRTGPGISGTPIDLTKVDQRALTDLQYDYRRVFSAVLQDFLGHGPNPLAAARMNNYTAPNAPFSKAPIIAASHLVDPTKYIDQIILPIVLTSLTANTLAANTIDVRWETSSETGSKLYEVQHSSNNLTWSTIGTVNAVGTSTSSRRYNFEHKTPVLGINYYRLQQIDINGARRIFGTAIAHIKDGASFVVKNYPNPAVFDFNLAITTDKKQTAQIQFMDVQGHLLLQQTTVLNSGFNKLNFNVNQFKGISGELIIYIQTDLSNKKVIKQVIAK
jgi:uncharacterized protein (DUF1501 family)